MSYLKKYGSKNLMFQEGGVAPAPEAAPAQAGPAEGGGQEEQIMALAEATLAGDQAAAAQLGTILAPMIMQEVQAAAGGEGGGQAPAPAEQPVFQKGGKFVGTTR